MNDDADADMARAYERDGFAVAAACVDPALSVRCLHAIEAIQANVAGLPPALKDKLVLENTLPARKRDGIPPEATGDAIFILGEPPAFDPEFADLIASEAIVRRVRRLLGTDDIRYHFSNVTMKRQRVGSGISWHRDFPNRYMSPARSSFLRVMICLDGMDADAGATEFLPGSHRIADADVPGSKAAALAGQVAPTVASCEPGALVFIHPKVVHGGPPNPSARHRRNVIVQWGRADDPVCTGVENAERLTGFGVEQIRAWRTAGVR